MDVHPPLAKMLIALTGWLGGFNGDFDFKDIGKDYLEPGVPYVTMRMFPAICGILTIPTMFLTLKAAGCRTTTAALGAGLVIFGMIVTVSTSGRVLTKHRQCACYSVSSYPPRFAPDHLHGIHRTRLDCLHKPTRAGSQEGLPAHMVVLAGSYWFWSGSYS
jgi:hypothetical protein